MADIIDFEEARKHRVHLMIKKPCESKEYQRTETDNAIFEFASAIIKEASQIKLLVKNKQS